MVSVLVIVFPSHVIKPESRVYVVTITPRDVRLTCNQRGRDWLEVACSLVGFSAAAGWPSRWDCKGGRYSIRRPGTTGSFGLAALGLGGTGLVEAYARSGGGIQSAPRVRAALTPEAAGHGASGWG